MKFYALLAITLAVVAAKDPATSAKAKADSVKAATAAIKKQQAFEAKHVADHEKAMAKADNEAQSLKNKVRRARQKQVSEGNQYPAFKTYWEMNWHSLVLSLQKHLFKNT